MKTLKDYIILDLQIIDERIESLKKQYELSEADDDMLRANIEYHQIIELIKIKELGIPSTVLAEQAYEAGKLDKELSIMFDNPKGRFLNHEIKLNK